MPIFTPIESRIVAVLADGLPHHPRELVPLIGDEMADVGNVQDHITNLRKKLNPIGEHVVCEFVSRQRLYRQVRLLPSACNGKR